MKLELRNSTSKPFVLFTELNCDEYEVLVDATVSITLEDNEVHMIKLRDDGVTLWNNGVEDEMVEIVPPTPTA